MTQPGREPYCRPGGKILSGDRANQPNNTQRHHQTAHFKDVSAIHLSDAVVYDTGNNQGNNQLKCSLQQLEQRAQSAFPAIPFHILQ